MAFASSQRPSGAAGEEAGAGTQDAGAAEGAAGAEGAGAASGGAAQGARGPARRCGRVAWHPRPPPVPARLQAGLAALRPRCHQRASALCTRGPAPRARVWVARGESGGRRQHRAPLSSAVSAHHRAVREDYGDKVKASHWGRSPARPPRERLEPGDSRKPGEAGAAAGLREGRGQSAGCRPAGRSLSPLRV